MEKRLVESLAIDLRTMTTQGHDVPSMLYHIQEVAGREDCKFLSIACFCSAFDVNIASAKPVAGWCGFGGELSDSQVESLMLPVLRPYRSNELKGR